MALNVILDALVFNNRHAKPVLASDEASEIIKLWKVNAFLAHFFPHNSAEHSFCYPEAQFYTSIARDRIVVDLSFGSAFPRIVARSFHWPSDGVAYGYAGKYKGESNNEGNLNGF